MHIKYLKQHSNCSVSNCLADSVGNNLVENTLVGYLDISIRLENVQVG